MIRLLLFTSLALAAILVVQNNLSAAGHHAQTSTRLVQDDSGNAQTADPSTTSDTGSSESSSKPAQGPD